MGKSVFINAIQQEIRLSFRALPGKYGQARFKNQLSAFILPF